MTTVLHPFLVDLILCFSNTMNTQGLNVFFNTNVHSVINFAIFYDNCLASVSFGPDFMLDSLPAHITMATLLSLLRLDW